jgi:lipopolysaccharide biosynthesis regulator YciM
LTEVPAEQLSEADRARLGRAYAQLGKKKEATKWLETTTDSASDPRALQILLVLYRDSEKLEKMRSLCDQLRGKSGLEDAREVCQSLEGAEDKATPERRPDTRRGTSKERPRQGPRDN